MHPGTHVPKLLFQYHTVELLFLGKPCCGVSNIGHCSRLVLCTARCCTYRNKHGKSNVLTSAGGPPDQQRTLCSCNSVRVTQHFEPPLLSRMAAVKLSDIVLPPEIGDDFAVQDITSQITGQNTWQATGGGVGRYTHPTEARARDQHHIVLGVTVCARHQCSGRLYHLVFAGIGHSWHSAHSGSRRNCATDRLFQSACAAHSKLLQFC